MAVRFPHLYFFYADQHVSVHDLAQMDDLFSAFHLPLSAASHTEFLMLQSILMTVQLSDTADIWIWPHSKGVFRTKAIYDRAHSHIQVDPTLKWIWKCSCTLKLKVFGWILLMGRLNTRDMMKRRHWNVEDDTCALCNTAMLRR